jgi:hypothetical protein
MVLSKPESRSKTALPGKNEHCRDRMEARQGLKSLYGQ